MPGHCLTTPHFDLTPLHGMPKSDLTPSLGMPGYCLTALHFNLMSSHGMQKSDLSLMPSHSMPEHCLTQYDIHEIDKGILFCQIKKRKKKPSP